MNRLILVSGCSGSGKTTIMRSVMDNEVVSFTTRNRRAGEVDGRDYIFITEEEFFDLLRNDGLVEYTQYGGNYYGISKSEIDTKLKNGDAFIIVDYNGVKQLKEIYKNTLTIFIYVEKDHAIENMRRRGDSEDQIKKRMQTYEEEIMKLIYYDEVVTNYPNDIEQAIEDIQYILSEYKERMSK